MISGRIVKKLTTNQSPLTTSKMKCIILAGGFATRLWPLTENKAKPLLHLKDRPLLSHLVQKLPVEMELIISTNAIFADDFYSWKESFPERNSCNAGKSESEDE